MFSDVLAMWLHLAIIRPSLKTLETDQGHTNDPQGFSFKFIPSFLQICFFATI